MKVIKKNKRRSKLPAFLLLIIIVLGGFALYEKERADTMLQVSVKLITTSLEITQACMDYAHINQSQMSDIALDWKVKQIKSGDKIK